MMPLTLANPGEENIIRKIGGKPEVKKHLENLGFVAGGERQRIPGGHQQGNGPENYDLRPMFP